MKEALLTSILYYEFNCCIEYLICKMVICNHYIITMNRFVDKIQVCVKSSFVMMLLRDLVLVNWQRYCLILCIENMVVMAFLTLKNAKIKNSKSIFKSNFYQVKSSHFILNKLTSSQPQVTLGSSEVRFTKTSDSQVCAGC
jgi:hypothetical protein